MRSKLFFLHIILILVLPQYSYTQALSPEKKVSICEGYITPQKALEVLEQKENITFSYNPQNFVLASEIYICKRNSPLKDIISVIMGKNVELVIENRHIIIKPAKYNPTDLKKPRTFKLSGTIENSINGMPVDSALIQIGDKKVYSNISGYFNILVSSSTDTITIYFEKQNYIGYMSTIEMNSDKVLRIFLKPMVEIDYTYLPSTIKDKNSLIETHWLANIVVSEEQSNLSKNHRALTDQDIQFSVLPNMGTYFEESGLCRFKQSYNLLAGYVGEVYGLEVGLGVNVIRYDLDGVQFAGIANIVGGEVSGWQISTGANVAIGNSKGVQTAVISNTTWGNFIGIQASTGVNLVKSKFRGFQIAPVNIILDTSLGCQIGGVNILSKPCVGTQFSAILNVAPINKKLQYSTFLNITGQNYAPQIGVINVSNQQSNLQLGLFNFADTVSGISIGFLSFVNNGFTYLDYSLNRDIFSSIKFKTGTWKFYNIISASFRPDKESDFAIGYGFGSYFKVWEMFGINYDLTTSHVFENNTFNQNLNLLSQFNLNLNFSVAKHFTIYFGGQLNGMFTSNLSADAITFESTIPATNTFYDKQFQNMRCYLWPGFLIGFRI